jgi:hypothetical protein
MIRNGTLAMSSVCLAWLACASLQCLPQQGIKVKSINLKLLVLAVGLAFGSAGIAQTMPKDDYQAGKSRIEAESKAAKAACTSMFGNARDVCEAEASGSGKVAGAELDASYGPTLKSRNDVRVVKAEADHAVARQRCDDMAGNAKDVCIKEAAAVETAAKADAKAKLTTAKAKAEANEKSASAFSKANEQAATAREEAAKVTNDAQYAVAVEKCDIYTGGAKDVCLDRAKARFGKS